MHRVGTITALAATGDTFIDFAPFVPAIADDGTVAFQAALRRGGSGIYAARPYRAEPSIEPIIEPGRQITEVLSHPAINAVGDCAFYAATPESPKCVVAVRRGRALTLAPAAGPLGPTINAAGAIAFRAHTPSGAEAIIRADARSITPIAETGPLYSAFHGLPVIDSQSRVLFRAHLTAGGQALVLGDGDSHRTIAATGDVFSALAPFPAINDTGLVVFAASLRAGGSGIFAVSDGSTDTIVDSRAPFESFRGALADASGRIVFYATTPAGHLGIFRGPDPRSDRILAIGDTLAGSTVAEFALNPVSINSAGQLAVRVRLADARQLIIRADPEGA